MKEKPDYELLYRIAQRYYIEGCSQQMIAMQENISRPHVSRLLTKARQFGIVTIRVEMPQSVEIRNLADQLQLSLNLRDVVLVEVPEAQAQDSRKVSECIARMAGQRLLELLGNSRNVGIGWGYTIYQTALLHPKLSTKMPLTFIPLVGISDENNPYLQSNVIVDRFAEKFNARSYYTSVPAFYQRDARKMPIEQDRYERLKQRWKNLDAAVVGLGPKFSDGDFLISEVSEEYKQLIANSQAVGDILASFFYEDGSILESSAYYEQISLPLEKLKSIPVVICMAGGDTKVRGLVSAARHGYYKTLITDQRTAQLMLDEINNKQGH
ncbi:MAG: sugar-binding transcriptional regulator [Anaerolineaceae bacterium]|jgi:deoxyribonucleoside regulator